MNWAALLAAQLLKEKTDRYPKTPSPLLKYCWMFFPDITSFLLEEEGGGSESPLPRLIRSLIKGIPRSFFQPLFASFVFSNISTMMDGTSSDGKRHGGMERKEKDTKRGL